MNSMEYLACRNTMLMSIVLPLGTYSAILSSISQFVVSNNSSAAQLLSWHTRERVLVKPFLVICAPERAYWKQEDQLAQPVSPMSLAQVSSSWILDMSSQSCPLTGTGLLHCLVRIRFTVIPNSHTDHAAQLDQPPLLHS